MDKLFPDGALVRPLVGSQPRRVAVLVAGALLLGGCAVAHRPPPRSELLKADPRPAKPPEPELLSELPDRPPPVPLTSAEPHPELQLVGIVHVVKKGETLYRIAKAYGVDPFDIIEVNGLTDPRSVCTGMELFIPGVERPQEVPTPAPGAPPKPEPTPAPKLVAPRAMGFIWPLKGVLYRRFGVRQGQRHDGIDIAAPEGTPIVAAARGTVAYAGRQAGYGNILILKHDGGLVTLYAHAATLLAQEGEHVEAGATIARVGQSGRTSGPHLHFEVREGTRPRNPLFYLP